jgi:2,4-dienoyl-CoA reductase-like NADH-dependent reductase (Old Yellow Enzyme family)
VISILPYLSFERSGPLWSLVIFAEKTMFQLFTPVHISREVLHERLVMVPITCSRADDVGVSGNLLLTCYEQRSDITIVPIRCALPLNVGKVYVRTAGNESDIPVAALKCSTGAKRTFGVRIAATPYSGFNS